MSFAHHPFYTQYGVCWQNTARPYLRHAFCHSTNWGYDAIFQEREETCIVYLTLLNVIFSSPFITAFKLAGLFNSHLSLY